MNHQPFETWLFEEDPQNLAALQQHLQECPSCQQLNQNWQSMRQQMRAAGQALPRSGFTARWRTGLEMRRLRAQQRRQVWVAFGVLATMLITSLVGFGLWAALSAPAGVIVFLTRSLTTLLTLNPQDSLQWLQTLPAAVPILFSMGLIGWIGLLGWLGFNALRRITHPGGEIS